MFRAALAGALAAILIITAVYVAVVWGLREHGWVSQHKVVVQSLAPAHDSEPAQQQTPPKDN